MPKRVVVVDDDRDVAELIQAILIDEGFVVTAIFKKDRLDVAKAVQKLEADCVILDGIHLGEEWAGWEIATQLGAGAHPVPAIMLTSDVRSQEEVFVGLSKRAQAAAFVSLIPKPFDIDNLIATVRRAVGISGPVGTDQEETIQHDDLLDRLRDVGAEDLRSSRIGREWATFKVGSALYKVYRWRSAGLYCVGRYSPAGDQLEPLGQFSDMDGLIAYCAMEIGRPA